MGLSLQKLINEYTPIDFSELNNSKLLNRIDTKFICHISLLPQILKPTIQHYYICQTNKIRNCRYQSLYFDTPQLKTYFDHHKQKRLRYKIRFRKYIETGDSFLEVKLKENFARTNKKRTQFELCNKLKTKHFEFIKKHINYNFIELNPILWTLFNRITLVGKNIPERITIDTDICFKNKNRILTVPNMVVIEVKRSKGNVKSFFIENLRNNNLKPFGISKYVLGNILLTPKIKHNLFKHKVRTINKNFI
ncbi:MAG: polyphosphate polymerase domain-containing protein [Bacteroidales bacterium]|nr:polyphosphate polymerase domain-containing protein [Bacteroidales bacterium]